MWNCRPIAASLSELGIASKSILNISKLLSSIRGLRKTLIRETASPATISMIQFQIIGTTTAKSSLATKLGQEKILKKKY